MRRFLGRAVRWLVVPVLVVLGAVTGGADGFVGWFVLAWMLWRGGPGMWADVKFSLGWLRGARRRLPFLGRRAAGGGLNV
jgi:hypothetical protein